MAKTLKIAADLALRVQTTGVGGIDPAMTFEGLPRRKKPQGGKIADAQFRHSRAAKAGRASALSYRKRFEAQGAKFDTRGLAYAAGYRTGYATAMRWWKRKYQREGKAA